MSTDDTQNVQPEMTEKEIEAAATGQALVVNDKDLPAVAGLTEDPGERDIIGFFNLISRINNLSAQLSARQNGRVLRALMAGPIIEKKDTLVSEDEKVLFKLCVGTNEVKARIIERIGKQLDLEMGSTPVEPLKDTVEETPTNEGDK